MPRLASTTPSFSASAERTVKTLLLITAGPYFWPEQPTVRARYDLLSRHYAGFILSFVSRPQYKRVRLGRFELIGYLPPGWVGRLGLLRRVARLLFTLGTALYLHFFRKRLDVIVTYDPLVTGPLGYLIRLLTGARLIVEVNGVYTNPHAWINSDRRYALGTRLKLAYAKLVIPALLNRADGTKLLYREQLGGFRRLHPRNRYFCFHDFVATAEFKADRPSEPYVLFVGHPWYLKGVDLLIQAFRQIAGEFPEYRLKIAGFLPERVHFASLYEGEPRIEFLGPFHQDGIIDLMSRCALFVLPSRTEAMGRVLLEAMASRKPIVAASVDGIPTYIKDGATGLLFRAGQAGDLAAKMREILANPTLARRLAENGYAYVRQHLSEERYMEAFRGMVESVTADGRKG